MVPIICYKKEMCPNVQQSNTSEINTVKITGQTTNEFIFINKIVIQYNGIA